MTMTLAGTDLVDVTALDARWIVDVRYATTDNFTGQQLYPVSRCLLRTEVAAKLQKAQAWIDAHHAGHTFILKDCYRPESVQRRMWEIVRNTPQRKYVADPSSATGSVHNYGAAVDLTLAGADRKELDMGTPYDFFGELAEPQHEERLVREGKLTAAQVANRRILRDGMVKGGGFLSLKHEWWHFDALQGNALRAKYQKMDVPLEAVLADGKR
jgi:zinc D-Ala-D-Ala dipeptidase